ncbi:unnamed protein product [marine sediment metagenome]|uniref:Uncharacterized protein n=1 Tax=marine sediment metagenome TaxID=412755 RepID=X1P9W5_9ZZZZ
MFTNGTEAQSSAFIGKRRNKASSSKAALLHGDWHLMHLKLLAKG